MQDENTVTTEVCRGLCRKESSQEGIEITHMFCLSSRFGVRMCGDSRDSGDEGLCYCTRKNTTLH